MIQYTVLQLSVDFFIDIYIVLFGCYIVVYCMMDHLLWSVERFEVD